MCLRSSEEAREAGGGSTRRKVDGGEVQDMRRGQRIMEEKIITSVSQGCWKVEMRWCVKSSCYRNCPHLGVKVLGSGSRPTTYWLEEVGQIPSLLYLKHERGWPRMSPGCSNSLSCHSDNLAFHLLSMYYVPGTVLK